MKKWWTIVIILIAFYLAFSIYTTIQTPKLDTNEQNKILKQKTGENKAENTEQKNEGEGEGPASGTPTKEGAKKDDNLEPKLVNGKTLEQRIIEANKQLHAEGSAEHARTHFPDLEVVYTDDGKEEGFPDNILPFKYHYSAEADRTFSLCAIERTVFICKGKFERKITDTEMNDQEKCLVTPIYAEYFD